MEEERYVWVYIWVGWDGVGWGFLIDCYVTQGSGSDYDNNPTRHLCPSGSRNPFDLSFPPTVSSPLF